MSSPVRMEQRTKLSVKNKITALFCANVSFFLIKLPPKKLSEVIEKLSKKYSKGSSEGGRELAYVYKFN